MSTIYELRKLSNDSDDYGDASCVIQSEIELEIVKRLSNDKDNLYLYFVTVWEDNETKNENFWTYDESLTADKFLIKYGTL